MATIQSSTKNAFVKLPKPTALVRPSQTKQSNTPEKFDSPSKLREIASTTPPKTFSEKETQGYLDAMLKGKAEEIRKRIREPGLEAPFQPRNLEHQAHPENLERPKQPKHLERALKVKA